MSTLYAFDANLSLHDGSALTATGVGTVAYFDVGGPYRFPAIAVANITALDLTTGNETYDLVIEGSVDAAFTTPKQLASQSIGAIGRYTLPIDNDQGGVVYQYIRYKPVLAGTTPILTGVVFLGLSGPAMG
jgi:hypothetical protein